MQNNITGFTVTTKVCDDLFLISKVVEEREMLSICTGGVTVILHVSLFPFGIVAIMSAFPGLIPVTSPFPSTVAILSSLLVHVTSISV